MRSKDDSPGQDLPRPSTPEEWCVRLAADYVSDADRRAFEAWCAEAPSNRADYEKARMVFDLCEGLMYAPDLTERSPSPPSERTPPFSFSRLRGAVLACVALALAGILSAGLWSVYGVKRPEYFATAVGEQSTVSLQDGSVVELNTDTAISVIMSAGRRSISLEKGEAYFSVAKDPSRPFYVDVGVGFVRVTGTKFNVKRQAGAAKVALFEGSISMGVRAEEGRRNEIALRPGQHGLLHASGAIDVAQMGSAEEPDAWRDGKVRFNEAPLTEVVAEFNRYSRVRLVIADKDLRTLTLSGVFRIKDRDALLFALREHLHIAAEPSGNDIALVKAGMEAR